MLAIQYRPTAALVRYTRNPRTHSQAQVDAIARSIQEFGWTNPILVDERGNVIAGHGRLMAADQLGMDQVPTIAVPGLTAAQRRALVIADNRLALDAGWDLDLLRSELSDLKGEGFDLSLTGFTVPDLDALFGAPDPEREAKAAGALGDRFLVPPFTVLSARDGWWQDRKRAWIALGIRSELGRGGPPGGSMQPLDRAKQGAALAYQSQDSLNRIQGQKRRRDPTPGGGGGGAWKNATADGYKTDEEIAAGLLFKNRQTAEFDHYRFESGTRTRPSAMEAGHTFGRIQNYEGADRTITGTSIFDPVLCEIAYRWFCPPGGVILDPFAGGSVRGIVAAKLGRSYVGVDLRAEQIAANRDQWAAIAALPAPGAETTTDDPTALTPVQLRGETWVKRDDLFVYGGVPGGKVRTCLALAMAGLDAAEGRPVGLVTAGSRASPQVNIVAHVAAALGLPARCHTPQGELAPEVVAAQEAGAEIVQHRAGYNSVIIKRAHTDAAARGWIEIPFGMECAEAVEQTRRQAAHVPAECSRIVMPAGSGMSLAGVLWGLIDAGRADVDVLGVVVGADPTKRLDAYAPPDWRDRVRLVPSGSDYHDPAPVTRWHGIELDPHYEAKCIPHIEPGDLFWIVGVRATAAHAPAEPAEAPSEPAPAWFEGDSAEVVPALDVAPDFVWTCPPYGDLEVYSDDPKDLSGLAHQEFVAAYKTIIAAAIAKLKPDRFAGVVVGDFRDKAGFYRNFVSTTIDAFEDAGARLYNEAILVTAVGSLPVRAGRAFAASRKMGKTHQNVLIFCKGDWRKAVAACGPVEIDEALFAEVIREDDTEPASGSNSPPA